MVREYSLTMNDQRTVHLVGVVSAVVGVGLTLCPVESGKALGLSAPARVLRGVGLVDLAVGAALLRPGASWQPMGWRSALNLAVCSLYVRSVAESPQTGARSRLGLAAMSVVTVFDGALTHRRWRASLGMEVSS
jgi:hypothetical protein